MAIKIIFGNQKGGSGKSTSTVLAANTLAVNYKVTVIDTDAQKSIVRARLMDTEGYTDILPYEVLNMNAATVESEIKSLNEKAKFLLFDVAGKLDTETKRIVNYANFLFVPVMAGNFGMDATVQYIKFVKDFIKQRKQSGDNRELKVYGFINRYKEGRRNTNQLKEEIADISRILDIPFMENHLGDYVLFDDTDTLVSSYSETSTDNAKTNFRNWYNEFFKIVTNG